MDTPRGLYMGVYGTYLRHDLLLLNFEKLAILDISPFRNSWIMP